MTLIKADSIALIRGERVLFKNLSFTLNEAQAIHLQGSNGSGKTSLFKLLNTFLFANKGELFIFDKEIKSLTDTDYKNMIYLGHLGTIKSTLSVIENIKLNAQIFDDIKPNKKALDNALEQVGLAHFRNQLAGKLSAGQKRRTMLARLFLLNQSNKKKIWLLDEPLTALDVTAIVCLEDRIKEHLTEGGGIIYTSHQNLTLDQSTTNINLDNYR